MFFCKEKKSYCYFQRWRLVFVSLSYHFSLLFFSVITTTPATRWGIILKFFSRSILNWNSQQIDRVMCHWVHAGLLSAHHLRHRLARNYTIIMHRHHRHHHRRPRMMWRSLLCHWSLRNQCHKLSNSSKYVVYNYLIITFFF